MKKTKIPAKKYNEALKIIHESCATKKEGVRKKVRAMLEILQASFEMDAEYMDEIECDNIDFDIEMAFEKLSEDESGKTKEK